MTDCKTLSINEVAEILRVSRPTVYALIRQRKLRSFKVGRCRRVTFKALQDCISAEERQGGSA